MMAGQVRLARPLASPTLTRCAAKSTRFPVMWAVKSPPRPRKPMTSVLPAITLSTAGSILVPGESPTDGIGAWILGLSCSASGNAISNHLSRVDDLLEALLVDVPGSERGLLQGQPLVIGLVRDCGGL